MIGSFEVDIVYQKRVSKEVEQEFYNEYIKGQPGEELAVLSTEYEEVYLVTCLIRGRYVSGSVLVEPGQALETACAVHFAYLIEG